MTPGTTARRERGVIIKIRAKDRVGTTVNGFKILDHEVRKQKSYFYVTCPFCGAKKWIGAGHVVSGDIKSCGCYKSPTLYKAKDLVGETFGRLTVIRAAGRQKDSGAVIWECACSCGSGKPVMATSSMLKAGFVRSCGCIQREVNKGLGKALGEDTLAYVVDGTNLRNLTQAVRKDNTSGKTGVTWDPRRCLWLAQIRLSGRRYHLGRYEDMGQAIDARIDAEDRLFGEMLERHKDEFHGQWKKWIEYKEIRDPRKKSGKV